MCTWARYDAAHANLRSTLEKSVCNEAISLSNAIQWTSNSEDAVVDAWDNLADSSSHTSLVTEISDVLASLADDDTGFLGRNDGAESELCLGVFFFGALGDVVAGVHAAH